MTLDEAIEHARWCADESIGECSEEHRQLAEWLEELRALRTSLIACMGLADGLDGYGGHNGDD